MKEYNKRIEKWQEIPIFTFTACTAVCLWEDCGRMQLGWCVYNQMGQQKVWKLWVVQQCGIFKKATLTLFSLLNVLQMSFASFFLSTGFQIRGKREKNYGEWWTVVMCFRSQAWNRGSGQRTEFSLDPGQLNEPPKNSVFGMSLSNKPKEIDDMMLTKWDKFWSIIYVNID